MTAKLCELAPPGKAVFRAPVAGCERLVPQVRGTFDISPAGPDALAPGNRGCRNGPARPLLTKGALRQKSGDEACVPEAESGFVANMAKTHGFAVTGPTWR